MSKKKKLNRPLPTCSDCKTTLVPVRETRGFFFAPDFVCPKEDCAKKHRFSDGKMQLRKRPIRFTYKKEQQECSSQTETESQS